MRRWIILGLFFCIAVLVFEFFILFNEQTAKPTVVYSPLVEKNVVEVPVVEPSCVPSFKCEGNIIVETVCIDNVASKNLRPCPLNYYCNDGVCIEEKTVQAEKEAISSKPELIIEQAPPGTGPKKVSSCPGKIDSGDYVLDSDLSVSTSSCFEIKDVDDVLLDCKGHTLKKRIGEHGAPMIYLDHAEDVVIKNCKFENENAGGNSGDYFINGENVKRITIKNIETKVDESIPVNRGTQSLHFYIADDILITGSEFDTMLTFTKADNIVVEDNRFVNRDLALGAFIGFQDGSDNVARNNFMDGGESRSICQFDQETMIDDGIVLDDQERALVENNRILNVGDCGIEHVGRLFDSEIIGNIVENGYICGIGGWYGASVKNTVFKNNRVISSTRPFFFFYIPSRNDDDVIYFWNNVFENNVIENDSSINCVSDDVHFYIITPTEDGSKEFKFGQNTFKNNRFTSMTKLSCKTAFSDGGGNVCTQSNIMVDCGITCV